MPDSLDIDTLYTAAAEAAGQGDVTAAATLLRRALDLQVHALGPDHQDLAPTLNNLAMMLERQGDGAEAERCYRRAYDVVRRAAGPDDPRVQVTRANLIAFLQAWGVAEPVVDVPDDGRPAAGLSSTPSPIAEASPSAAPPAFATAPPRPRREPPRSKSPAPSLAAAPRRAPTKAATPVATTSPTRDWRVTLAVAAGAAAAVVAGWLLIARQPPGQSRESRESRETPPISAAVPADPAQPPAGSVASKGSPAGTAVPPPVSKPAEAQPAPGAADPPSPAPRAGSRGGNAAGVAGRQGESARPGVDGRLCTTLERSGGVWRCDPAGDSTAAGSLYYYSRVRSNRDLVVRHRWTYQGQVVQTVSLEVRANPQDGYRTFSRQRLAGRAGPWEVALIAPDGTVVDTQRFTVTGSRN